MGHCKDCKHWDGPPDFGAPIGKIWGVCVLGDSSNGDPDNANTMAYAEDGEQYGARLLTTHDFGCVPWESA